VTALDWTQVLISNLEDKNLCSGLNSFRHYSVNSIVMESLAVLIESTMLTDRRIMTRSVAYAIEHSMSAFYNLHAKATTTSQLYVVFDWFVTLARAFALLPTGVFHYSGDSLWISKDVVISLQILAEHRPDLVKQFKSQYVAERKHSCGAKTRRTLRETNFEGGLLRYVVVELRIDTSGPFSSGKCFMRYALQHARNAGTPLTTLELLCASAFVAWSMASESDVAPWNRQWRINDEHALQRLQNSAVIYSGQRRAALHYLHGINAETALEAAFRGELPRDSHAFRGVWLLGSGNDNILRSALLSKMPTLNWSPWASVLIPWIAPSFVDTSTDTRTAHAPFILQNDRLVKVRIVLSVAALLDAIPEAYDVCTEAWIDAREARRCRDDRFPHLSHVSCKRERYIAQFTPPDTLCQAIVECANAFVQKHKHTAKFHEAEVVAVQREHPSPNIDVVVNRLRNNACDATADAFRSFGLLHGPCTVFAFAENSTVSWPDLVFSQASVWPKVMSEAGGIVGRTADQHFCIVAEKYATLPLYSHPLTALRSDAQKKHPLWSPRTELLAALV